MPFIDISKNNNSFKKLLKKGEIAKKNRSKLLEDISVKKDNIEIYELIKSIDRLTNVVDEMTNVINEMDDNSFKGTIKKLKLLIDRRRC